ncbi:MAG: hypothetical protein HY899_12120 [Deltaproteobacteria bacterium]|nr:hypothetical protein [Deltaproteobacteria bacterium]
MQFELETVLAYALTRSLLSSWQTQHSGEPAVLHPVVARAPSLMHGDAGLVWAW